MGANDRLWNELLPLRVVLRRSIPEMRFLTLVPGTEYVVLGTKF